MEHLDPELLDQYLDGALPEPTRLAVELHLASCAECQNELQRQQAVFAALTALPLSPLPADLVSPVLQRVSRPKAAAWPGWFWGLLGLQAVFAVLLAVWLNPALLQLQSWSVTLLTGLALLQRASLQQFAEWQQSIVALQTFVLSLPGAFEVTALANIAPLHWALALSLAGLLWLLGNRWLLHDARIRG